jgi:hypothetical protein
MRVVSDREAAGLQKITAAHRAVLGLLQIQRVEALGEPAVDRGEKIVGLVSFVRRVLAQKSIGSRTAFIRNNRTRRPRPWTDLSLLKNLSDHRGYSSATAAVGHARKFVRS